VCFNQVSSIGAIPFKMDEWGVDIAITGSQKALCLPTGLGLTCVSPKALEATKTAKLPRVFFSYDDMGKANKAGNFPYTPSIPLLYGLRESIALMREETIEEVWARHQRMGDATRAAVAAWGLKLLCKDPRWNSNALTVVEGPAGVDTNDIVKTAYCKYNLTIGVGLSEVNGKVFRIGHLGDMNECSMLGAIAGVEMVLKDVGMDIKFGSGVGAAAAFFQRTSSVIRTREILGDHIAGVKK
jgi:alanine-glyoxylate transaminase/serine-glyoxylate transaminase/serine-pyruvate transaminase